MNGRGKSDPRTSALHHIQPFRRRSHRMTGSAPIADAQRRARAVSRRSLGWKGCRSAHPPLSDSGSFGHIPGMRLTALLLIMTPALAGLSSCKQQADRCSGFPQPSGKFPVLTLYPPQFSGEPPREITYSDARSDDPNVRKAQEIIALCYSRKPQGDFKDSLDYIRFVEARLSPSGQYYLLYEFSNMTDVRLVFELNRQGGVQRSMVGSMVDE